jgi:hypothetical protein
MELALPRRSPHALLIIVFIACCFSATPVQAQNPLSDNIEWTASSLRDLATNEDFTIGCQFVTYGKSKINWIQDSGNSVSQLNVTSTIGSWSNINNEGSITYKFSDGTLSGELVISKSGSQWVAELTMVGGTDDIRLRYSISSVKKI